MKTARHEGLKTVISDDGKYRYTLYRELGGTGPTVAFFGVNPSTATAVESDHTVSKMVGFSQKFGFGGFYIANIFAWRSKDVRQLAAVEDPIGPDNHRYIRQVIDRADILIPCWGSRKKVPKELWPQFDAMANTLKYSGTPGLSFGITQSGDPRHPLMLPYSTKLCRAF